MNGLRFRLGTDIDESYVGRRPIGASFLFERQRSDAVVVGTPVDDALLDGLRFQILRESSVSESGEFRVGGEAKGDELPDGELVDEAEVGGRQKSGEAEALFEPDDAVLS